MFNSAEEDISERGAQISKKVLLWSPLNVFLRLEPRDVGPRWRAQRSLNHGISLSAGMPDE